MSNIYKLPLPSPGFFTSVTPLDRNRQALLPVYLKEAYTWYVAEADDRRWLLASCPTTQSLSVKQLETQMKRATQILGLPAIVVFDQLAAYNRKRLMEKGIPFIVSDKQVYIPTYLIDLKETRSKLPDKPTQLTPMGQVLLFRSLLDREGLQSLRKKSFKELASFFQVRPMQITRAAESLGRMGLIAEHAGKEKFIRFIKEGRALWEEVLERDMLIDPVMRRVYLENPAGEDLPMSGGTALSAYTDMNPPRQISRAIYRKAFHPDRQEEQGYQVEGTDAPYCLELWKYDPRWLMNVPGLPTGVVDPLSLYVSLRHEKDARVEMAVQQLINQAIW